jgi:chromate transporter
VIYWQLFFLFAGASLMAFGGAIGMLPSINDTIVNTFHWMDTEAVMRSYVLGQFMPGPNMVMATLIGYQVAGLAGATSSTLGMYLGPITVTSVVTGIYYRNRGKSHIRRIEIALRPLALGLVLAATLQFLSNEMRSNMIVGLCLGLPLVWLHWRGHINTLIGVFLMGAGWYAAYRFGFLANVTIEPSAL